MKASRHTALRMIPTLMTNFSRTFLDLTARVLRNSKRLSTAESRHMIKAVRQEVRIRMEMAEV
jgi:hypothetical protein